MTVTSIFLSAGKCIHTRFPKIWKWHELAYRFFLALMAPGFNIVCKQTYCTYLVGRTSRKGVRCQMRAHVDSLERLQHANAENNFVIGHCGRVFVFLSWDVIYLLKLYSLLVFFHATCWKTTCFITPGVVHSFKTTELKPFTQTFQKPPTTWSLWIILIVQQSHYITWVMKAVFPTETFYSHALVWKIIHVKTNPLMSFSTGSALCKLSEALSSISSHRDLSAPLRANIWSWCWQDNTHMLHNFMPAGEPGGMTTETPGSGTITGGGSHGAHPLDDPQHAAWLSPKHQNLSSLGNNCPRSGNRPVLQGLTLQFVIRLRLLLKLLSDLEVGNDSRFGLHTCRCQLLETSKPEKKTHTDGFLCRGTSLSTNRCQRKPPLSGTRSAVVLRGSEHSAADGQQAGGELQLPTCAAAVDVITVFIGCSIRADFPQTYLLNQVS